MVENPGAGLRLTAKATKHTKIHAKSLELGSRAIRLSEWSGLDWCLQGS